MIVKAARLSTKSLISHLQFKAWKNPHRMFLCGRQFLSLGAWKARKKSHLHKTWRGPVTYTYGRRIVTGCSTLCYKFTTSPKLWRCRRLRIGPMQDIEPRRRPQGNPVVNSKAGCRQAGSKAGWPKPESPASVSPRRKGSVHYVSTNIDSERLDLKWRHKISDLSRSIEVPANGASSQMDRGE